MTPNAVRVRFAPSPTGPLHMGGVRTALYNYLFAKKHGGTFILRIEDTDQNRFVPGAEEYIVEALKWCGIEPDESPENPGAYGPYRQSERKGLYAQYADLLVQKGWAYYAFDDEAAIAAKRTLAEENKTTFQYDASTRMEMRNSESLPKEESEALIAEGNWVIRFKMPAHREVVFTDAIRGEVKFNTAVLDDKVLMKGDGMPTYHLANIVDDHLMEITHVIRGEEWLPSAPLHVLLYEAFGWSAPTFAHLPLILKPTGNGKLSKRDGEKGGFPVFPLNWTDPSSGETWSSYQGAGYSPEAFLNMLLLLGWNPGTEKELYSLDEAVQDFSLERVVKSGARFNPEKAVWFNESHLRETDNAVLVKQLLPLLEAKGRSVSEEQALSMVLLLKERVQFLHQITEANYLFEAPASYDEKTTKKKWKANTPEVMSALREVLAATAPFDAATIEHNFKAFLEEKELGFGAVLPGFRLLLTGEAGGPGMYEIAAFLGKEESLKRMDEGMKIAEAWV